MKYLFVSDVHLGVHASRAHNDELERRFLLFLDKVESQNTTLFLLGDIFDFWFEYSNAIPAAAGHAAVIGKLKLLRSQGCTIHFFKGNHDMWLRNYLEHEVGLIVHNKTEIIELDGDKYMIGHGHDLCFNRTFLTRVMSCLFNSRFIYNLTSYIVHPNLMMRFGNNWSKSSRKSKNVCHKFNGEDEYITQVITNNLDKNRADGVKGYIFGHFHCPTLYTLSDNESKLMILGEWSVAQSPYYGKLENGKLSLENFYIK